MVEVFKTNVENIDLANQLISTLRMHFPFSKINFDLEDCDKILRIEDNEICVKTIIELVRANGFTCAELD